jgi:hypothetical protein
MKLIATHKITFAIGHKGSAILVDIPAEMAESGVLDGDSLDDNAFTETPTEAGFYRATAEVWFQQGYMDGYPADGESEIEIRTVDVERVEASGSEPAERSGAEQGNTNATQPGAAPHNEGEA